MTVIPHRSIDHIQKRSSGRSNSVSSATLKTPSCPTTIDHGWSAHGVAVAGDLRTVERAGLTSLAETARASRPVPAGPVPRPRGVTRRRAPMTRAAPGASRPAPLRSGRRSRRGGGPAIRPGRSRGSRGPGGARRSRPRPGSRARSPRRSGSSGSSGEWTSSSGSPLGTGRAGGTWGAASRVATSAAWSWPIGESGVSAWPWKRPSTMNVDSPWRTRTSVASSPSGIERGSPGRVNGPRPSRIVHRSRTASWVADRLGDGIGDVVVERQDHERVLARPRPGEVHRADVDVGLAEHHADPPDRARPVHVAGDEHVVGRRHVEPVVVEPGDPRLAAGDGPGDDRRPAAGLARQRERAPRTRRRRASCARRR